MKSVSKEALHAILLWAWKLVAHGVPRLDLDQPIRDLQTMGVRKPAHAGGRASVGLPTVLEIFEDVRESKPHRHQEAHHLQQVQGFLRWGHLSEGQRGLPRRRTPLRSFLLVGHVSISGWMSPRSGAGVGPPLEQAVRASDGGRSAAKKILGLPV